MLHIYWGMGKGKTSTLNGSAIRAKGANLKVGYFRFLKGRSSHEIDVLKSLGIDVYSYHFSSKFVIEMNEKEKQKTKEMIEQGIQQMLELSSNYDLIIIDEFLDLAASSVNMLNEEEILKVIQKINQENNELMISGHTELKKVFALADLITYFESQKHYFDKKVQARKGIEF